MSASDKSSVIYKVGVIGVGFVGSAIARSFKEKQVNTVLYDKFKNIGTFEEILKGTDLVFLCLPTPFDSELAEYNITPLEETCQRLRDHSYQGVIVIKSTVNPDTSDYLGDKYELELLHNPEFLSQQTAYEDFHNQRHIVIGKASGTSEESCDVLVEFYDRYYPVAEISICQAKESEMVKIACNSFYAVKVAYFNELYDLCEKNGTRYDNVREMMLRNNWIYPLHTIVPYPDNGDTSVNEGKGTLGFSGSCLPKDSLAFLSYQKKKGSLHNVVSGAVKDNKILRPEIYD